MLDTDTTTDLRTLIDYDAPVRCDHSQHESDPEMHSGDAKYMLHMVCPGGCGKSRRYPACAPFVSHINSGNVIHCHKCGITSLAPMHFKEIVLL